MAHHYSAAQSHKAQVERESVFKVVSLCLCATSDTVGEKERVKSEIGVWVGLAAGSHDAKTHRRVPRMTSSMDPAALDWLRLGTSGRRVRGGGFLRRADWAGRDSEEVLCSRVRRGRGLLEGTTLEPGLWHARSSGSLCGKERMNEWCISTCCQLTVYFAKQGVKTRDKNMAWVRLYPSCCLLLCKMCLAVNGKQELQDYASFHSHSTSKITYFQFWHQCSLVRRVKCVHTGFYPAHPGSSAAGGCCGSRWGRSGCAGSLLLLQGPSQPGERCEMKGRK